MKLSNPSKGQTRVQIETEACDRIARNAASNEAAFDALCGRDLVFAADSLMRIRGMSNAQILALINSS